jgi:hypothetical protein
MPERYASALQNATLLAVIDTKRANPSPRNGHRLTAVITPQRESDGASYRVEPITGPEGMIYVEGAFPSRAQAERTVLEAVREALCNVEGKYEVEFSSNGHGVINPDKMLYHNLAYTHHADDDLAEQIASDGFAPGFEGLVWFTDHPISGDDLMFVGLAVNAPPGLEKYRRGDDAIEDTHNVRVYAIPPEVINLQSRQVWYPRARELRVARNPSVPRKLVAIITKGRWTVPSHSGDRRYDEEVRYGVDPIVFSFGSYIYVQTPEYGFRSQAEAERAALAAVKEQTKRLKGEIQVEFRLEDLTGVARNPSEWLMSLPETQREAVNAILRKMNEEAERLLAKHKQLSPRYGEIPMGGAHIDPMVQAYAIEGMLRAVLRGATVDEAIEAGKQDARLTVQKWNAIRKRDVHTQRWEGMADTDLEHLGRQLREAAQL